jgi:hypothetical protein
MTCARRWVPESRMITATMLASAFLGSLFNG